MRTLKSKIFLFVVVVVMGVSVSCGSSEKSQTEDTIVLIETEFGDIKIKLYKETPIHYANFLKLANEGFYNDIVFHRVIQNFMIQGGDPSTKPQIEGDSIKLDDAGYVLDAEFVPSFFHKKGALAAARMGDNVNPEKQSSGSQFYIVQGKVFTAEELTLLAEKKNEQFKNSTINNIIMNSANEIIDRGENPDFNLIVESLKDTIEHIKANTNKYEFTPEQIQVYTTVGGTPHLDKDYTVFGEVIMGLDVVDKIAAVETGLADRPIKDVRMKIKVIK